MGYSPAALGWMRWEVVGSGGHEPLRAALLERIGAWGISWEPCWFLLC